MERGKPHFNFDSHRGLTHSRRFVNTPSSEAVYLSQKVPEILEKSHLLCPSSPVNFIGALILEHAYRTNPFPIAPSAEFLSIIRSSLEVRYNVPLWRYNSTYRTGSELEDESGAILTADVVLYRKEIWREAGLVVEGPYSGLVLSPFGKERHFAVDKFFSETLLYDGNGYLEHPYNTISFPTQEESQLNLYISSVYKSLATEFPDTTSLLAHVYYNAFGTELNLDSFNRIVGT